MAVAMIVPKQQGKKSTSSVSKEVGGERVSCARTVLAPDLAPGVLSGSVSLDAAYQQPGHASAAV